MKPSHLYLALSYIACNFLACARPSGQPDPQTTNTVYPIPKQRLQLKLTTSFLYFSLQGHLDMDSAAILVSEGEHLPYSLYYDEDYCKGPDGRIKTLLEKGSYHLFKAGSERSDLDSALPLFLSARQEAAKNKDIYFQNAAFAALGRYYLQANDAEASKTCFTDAVDLARKANDPTLLYRALANRGTHAGFADPQKEKDLNEALGLSRQLHDTIGEIGMLTGIYEIYFVHRKFDTVKDQLLHVTDLERLVGFRHTHYNHRVLAFLNYRVSNWGDVFTECKKAVAVMEDNQDRAFSNFIYGAMAQIYSDFEDYGKAVYWLDKSIQEESFNKAKRIWYPQFTDICINNAKTGHFRQTLEYVLNIIKQYPPVARGDKMKITHLLGYCYHELGQDQLCEEHYAVMEPYLDSLKSDPSQRPEIFSGYMDLARNQLSKGNIASTQKYFRQAKLFADSSDLFSVARIHGIQSKLDSCAGNYFSALKENRLAEILDDSIYNVGKARQFSELQIEYETEAKDKNIELLQQKDKVTQANLRQSNTMRKITLAGIVGLLVVTSLIYNQYRIKHRRNKEMDQKNRQLEQLVKDKEWLVREIHHRVKNNFHTVASLLEIQSSYLKNTAALSAIKESQHRIHSMSIIHQKLYQSDSLSTINMPEYIYELVEYLVESYGIRQTIAFSLQIENIALDHASAITLGLILNEAITNSIKYAFPKEADGNISIGLSHSSDSRILLCIADNGRGLPTDFDSRKEASMGMELLQGLTDDLGGTFSIETKNGTQIKIIFALSR